MVKITLQKVFSFGGFTVNVIYMFFPRLVFINYYSPYLADLHMTMDLITEMYV